MIESMDTAPTDETDIIVFSWANGTGKPHIGIVRWCAKHDREYGDVEGEPICNPRWCATLNDKCSWYFRPDDKLRWMPLPKLPTG